MPKLYRFLSLASLLTALAVLILAGLTWRNLDEASSQNASLRKTAQSASQLTYRLQALTTAYELTLNEYYSTVIDETRYREKVVQLLHAIESDIARLAKLDARENQLTSNELTQQLAEMEKRRTQLNQAMLEPTRDWDVAREALFKINILSTQAIETAAKAASASDEKIQMLDQNLNERHQQLRDQLIALLALAGLLSALTGVQSLRRS